MESAMLALGIAFTLIVILFFGYCLMSLKRTKPQRAPYATPVAMRNMTYLQSDQQKAMQFEQDFPPPSHSHLTEQELRVIKAFGIQAFIFELVDSTEGIKITDGLSIAFSLSEPRSLLSKYPLAPDPQQTSRKYCYFEVHLTFCCSSNDPPTIINIGLATKPYPPFRMVGCNRYSIGYSSIDGRLFTNSDIFGKPFAAPFKIGDVVGCGYDLQRGAVFFTLNGIFLGDATVYSYHPFHAAVSANGPCQLEVNYGQKPFRFSQANSMVPDSPSATIEIPDITRPPAVLNQKSNTFPKILEQSILSKQGPGFLFMDGDSIIGFVPETTVEALKESPIFQIHDRTISLVSTDRNEKSQQLKELILQWVKEERFHCLNRWRNEEYAVYNENGISFQLERAAIGLFGCVCYGTHLNAYVMDHGILKMWVSRRSFKKKTHPSMLDNLVGGGLALPLSPTENLMKEAYEEAGIPKHLIQQAKPKGYISTFFIHETQEWFPILDYVYDLELEQSFQPRAVDGEVEEFYLWDLPTVEQHLDEFTMDTCLVVLDFMVRHGYLTPEHSDYLDIVSGLRRPFVFPLRK